MGVRIGHGRMLWLLKSSPLDVRALPLALPAVVVAVGAALTGRERRPRPWRAVLAALAVWRSGAPGPPARPVPPDPDGAEHPVHEVATAGT